MHRDAILRRSLLRAGASDSVTKDSSVPALVDAIRHAHVHRSTAAIASAPMLLTSREVEVLRLIADARSNADIAVELRLAVGTVKRHVHNLFRKLDASSRLEAIARARLLGVLDDPAGDVSS